MTQRRILITGALGFVGSELARTLLLSGEVERLVLIVRPAAGLSGAERFARLVDYWRKFVPVPDARELAKIEFVEADLESVASLRIEGMIDVIYHAAASTDLGAALGPSRRDNLFLTQKTLELARRLSGLRRFVHFSTAYVCGKRRGKISESDGAPDHFHNHYERSKRESEDAVRHSGLPFTILRPSIIVGRSDDGYVYKLKVLYSVWRMWLSGFVPRAPIDPKAWVDIVPIDFVVGAALKLSSSEPAVGGTYHLCAGDDRQSPRTIMACAARVFGIAMPPISPPWVAHMLRIWPVKLLVPHTLREILKMMYWHLPYLGIRGRLFDMSATRAALAETGLDCPTFSEYGETMFRFCKETSWGKRPPREKACSASA